MWYSVFLLQMDIRKTSSQSLETRRRKLERKHSSLKETQNPHEQDDSSDVPENGTSAQIYETRSRGSTTKVQRSRHTENGNVNKVKERKLRKKHVVSEEHDTYKGHESNIKGHESNIKGHESNIKGHESNIKGQIAPRKLESHYGEKSEAEHHLSSSFQGKMLVNSSRAMHLAAAILRNVGVLVLYFGASWCDRSRKWTSILKGLKQYAIEKGIRLEIIFVPSENTEEEFWQHFSNDHGDWWAAPHKSELAILLNYEYAVTAIPFIVAMRPDGTILSRTGVQDLEEETTFEEVLIKWLPHLRRRLMSSTRSFIRPSSAATTASHASGNATAESLAAEITEAVIVPEAKLEKHMRDVHESQASAAPKPRIEAQTPGPPGASQPPEEDQASSSSAAHALRSSSSRIANVHVKYAYKDLRESNK